MALRQLTGQEGNLLAAAVRQIQKGKDWHDYFDEPGLRHVGRLLYLCSRWRLVKFWEEDAPGAGSEASEAELSEDRVQEIFEADLARVKERSQADVDDDSNKRRKRPKQDRTGRKQDRTGQEQDRTGRKQDRTDDRTGRKQDRTDDRDRSGRCQAGRLRVPPEAQGFDRRNDAWSPVAHHKEHARIMQRDTRKHARRLWRRIMECSEVPHKERRPLRFHRPRSAVVPLHVQQCCRDYIDSTKPSDLETAENMFYACWEFGWPDGEADEVARGVRDLFHLRASARMSGSRFPLDGHPLALLWEKFRQGWEGMMIIQTLDEVLALVIQFVEDNESDNEEEEEEEDESDNEEEEEDEQNG